MGKNIRNAKFYSDVHILQNVSGSVVYSSDCPYGNTDELIQRYSVFCDLGPGDNFVTQHYSSFD